VDDNARALIVAIRALALTGESGLLDYVRHYLAFVERCQRPDGRFRNFMAADGTWLDELGSEDANGRAIWALGFAARHSAQAEVRIRALHCLDQALDALASPSPAAFAVRVGPGEGRGEGTWRPGGDQGRGRLGLSWLHAQAFALLGFRDWREAEPSAELDELTVRFAASLAGAFERSSRPDWRWFEDELTYCNARLPEALLGTRYAGIGLQSLAWLCGVLEVDGCISLIGNRGWYPRGGPRAVYDQQAVDASALVSACAVAHRLSGDGRFRRWAELGYSWFEGNNVGRRPMVDPETGGCCDGLEAGGVNLNQGAESLLAWLLAWEDMAEQGWV